MVVSARLLKCVVKLPAKSGIARDTIDMTLHYTAPTGYVQSDFDAFAQVMKDFYEHSLAGTVALNTFIGNSRTTSTNPPTVTFYAVPATRGALGAPVGASTWTPSTWGSDGLPAEVSACLSFRADYGTAVEFGPGRATRPRARLRNRIYLGPLSSGALQVDGTTGRAKIHANLLTSATERAKSYLKDAMGTANWTWKVWSETDWQDYTPTVAWMDDAYDTQRSRGEDPVGRTTKAL